MHLARLLRTCLQEYAAISAARRSCAPRRTAPAAACWTTPSPVKVSPLVLQDLIAPLQLVMQAIMEVYSHLWSTTHTVTTLTAILLDCLKSTALCCIDAILCSAELSA